MSQQCAGIGMTVAASVEEESMFLLVTVPTTPHCLVLIAISSLLHVTFLVPEFVPLSSSGWFHTLTDSGLHCFVHIPEGLYAIREISFRKTAGKCCSFLKPFLVFLLQVHLLNLSYSVLSTLSTCKAHYKSKNTIILLLQHFMFSYFLPDRNFLLAWSVSFIFIP